VAAVAAVIVVLLALNRSHDEPSPPVVDATGGAPSLAQEPQTVEPDVAVGKVENADSGPNLDVSPDLDAAWMAGSLPTSAPTASGQSPLPVDPSGQQLAIDVKPKTMAEESADVAPGYEPETQIEYAQTPDTAHVAQTPATDWAAPNDDSVAGRHRASPERASYAANPGPTMTVGPAPPAENHERSSARLADNSFPERFQRASTAGLGPEGPGPAPQEQPSPEPGTATAQTYPSTPYRATFARSQDSWNDGRAELPAARTAERDARRYGRLPSQPTDANRAGARLQGRIEPLRTGSHEQHR
jgi:hypothetical protein